MNLLALPRVTDAGDSLALRRGVEPAVSNSKAPADSHSDTRAAKLLSTQASVQRLAVEAAVRASKEIALQAQLIDPVVNSASAALKFEFRRCVSRMKEKSRCGEIWGKQSRISCTIHEDRDSAVGEHLERLAAEHDRGNPAPPM